VIHNQTLCYQYSIEAKQWTKIPASFPPAAGFTSAISYGDFIYLTGKVLSTEELLFPFLDISEKGVCTSSQKSIDRSNFFIPR